MEIEDIISFDDKEYIILDETEYNNDKYLYCVMIDKDENPTEEYAYFKSIEENNEYYVEEVEDEDILSAIIAIFTGNLINECIDDEQED